MNQLLVTIAYLVLVCVVKYRFFKHYSRPPTAALAELSSLRVIS
jgi:hypothetical protein